MVHTYPCTKTTNPHTYKSIYIQAINTHVSGHVGHLGDASGVVGHGAVGVSSEGDGEDGQETCDSVLIVW